MSTRTVVSSDNEHNERGSPMQFMKRLIIGACVVSLVASASAAPANGNAAAVAAIRNNSAAWVKAYNAGDAEAVLGFFAEDAVVMPPGAPTLRDNAAIRQFVLRGIAGAKAKTITLTLGSADDLGAAGNLAWHSGPFAILDKSGAAIDTGKYLETWRKIGGNWRMIRRIWNSDGQGAAAAAPIAAPPAVAPK
jgi:ketosteroid isomerase-like protein